MLCWASRLLPISSCVPGTCCRRFFLIRLTFPLQVKIKYLFWCSKYFILDTHLTHRLIFYLHFILSSRSPYLNNKKYSSSAKTEQKASKDASNINRAPPLFTRKPSRRQIRRNFDSNHHEQSFETDNKRKFETKSISVPQPAYTYVKVIFPYEFSFLYLLVDAFCCWFFFGKDYVDFF